jgi:hypothetical protein
LNRLYQRLLTIPVQEATFSRRGFDRSEPLKQQRLEQSGRSFLHGYHHALAGGTLHDLQERLNSIEPDFRGFGFEGAAMGLTLLGRLLPWRKEGVKDFLDGPGSSHTYMVHVGIGWALARLPRYLQPDTSRLDTLLRWLVIDGYGFHEGYFHPDRYVNNQVMPSRLSGYARRAFDQGLGRSIWFVKGADIYRISGTIRTFDSSRRADLWSGAGLACAYAGGLDHQELLRLQILSGPYAHYVAQGASFAAKTRQRAGNQAAHTDQACEVLCGMSSDAAATVTDVALNRLPPGVSVPQYEIWRRRIQEFFAHRLKI